MKLTNDFVVDAPLASVWALFDQLERTVPCMPGAAYLGPEDGRHRVSMKVKIGAVVTNFLGTVDFVEKDVGAHRVVMRGAAKDTGGKGTAAALIESRLASLGSGRTRVEVVTDLNMTGRVAQFGGPIVSDIAQRLVQQFTANLHREVLSGSAPVVAPAGDAAPAQGDAQPTLPAGDAVQVQPLDLGAVVGASLWGRIRGQLLAFFAGGLAGWLLARIW